MFPLVGRELEKESILRQPHNKELTLPGNLGRERLPLLGFLQRNQTVHRA